MCQTELLVPAVPARAAFAKPAPAPTAPPNPVAAARVRGFKPAVVEFGEPVIILPPMADPAMMAVPATLMILAPVAPAAAPIIRLTLPGAAAALELFAAANNVGAVPPVPAARHRAPALL